jgi:hypothetical protein
MAASATPLQDLDQPGAAPRRPRLARRGALDLAAAEADRRCGLVGLPNAGKSTFLSAVTAARPKIADYPFTTLNPQLGVVPVDEREFVMADIPGLIEGAHEGAGLGDRFLGHVERCRVLLHLIDGTQDDVVADAYRTVRRELKEYGGNWREKPEIVGAQQDRRHDARRDQEKKQALRAARQDAAGKAPCTSSPGAVGPGGQGGRAGCCDGTPSDEAPWDGSAPVSGAPHDPAWPTRAGGWSSRSAPRCWSTMRPAKSPGMARSGWPTTSRACASAAASEVMLVSSGAIGVGRRISADPAALRLEEKQAAAATGQIRLAHAYQETWRPRGITVAQVLLTLDDTEERRRYLNARNTLETLLGLGAVPVINENDTVATARSATATTTGSARASPR